MSTPGRSVKAYLRNAALPELIRTLEKMPTTNLIAGDTPEGIRVFLLSWHFVSFASVARSELQRWRQTGWLMLGGGDGPVTLTKWTLQWGCFVNQESAVVLRDEFQHCCVITSGGNNTTQHVNLLQPFPQITMIGSSPTRLLQVRKPQVRPPGWPFHYIIAFSIQGSADITN